MKETIWNIIIAAIGIYCAYYIFTEISQFINISF